MIWDTLLAALATALSGPAAAQPVTLHGCPSRLLETMDGSRKHGDFLTLEQISCIPFQPSHYTMGDAIVSPDGRSAVRWHGGSPAPIEAASLTGTKLFELPNQVTFRDIFRAGFDPIAWASDSKSVLTVVQDTAPGGWARGGLKPVRIDFAGTLLPLPELNDRAGSLDALMWIGGDGLALAQFGTRGSYYRPEQLDLVPTLAIVDAVKGQVRASLPAATIPELRPQLKRLGLSIQGATASILRDGRVRTILQFRTLPDRFQQDATSSGGKMVSPGIRVIWTEGQPPRTVLTKLSPALALTPDGTQLLAVHGLQPSGVVISECQEDCPPDPQPVPVEGPLAELTDVDSGKLLWRMISRAEQPWSQRAAPAISPDGRFALIEIPPENRRSMIALVSMKDGRILQRFSAVGVGSYKQALSFSPDGRSVWLACNNLIVRYRLNVR